jgi:hypothetical protein
MDPNNPHQLDRETLEAFEALRKMPPCPINQKVSVEDAQYSRCHCNKLVEKNKELRVRWSGYVYYLDNACEGCRKDLDKDVKIICVGCKGRVVIRVPASKDKDGFMTTPGGCLHVRACRVCNPNLEESPIVEKVAYLNRINKSL